MTSLNKLHCNHKMGYYFKKAYRDRGEKHRVQSLIANLFKIRRMHESGLEGNIHK